MSSMHPQDRRPGGADQQRLQGLIDTLAQGSQGDPIGVVRDRLVEMLGRSGFTPPSESWVDAVAREAVHGRVYGISAESMADHELATPEEKALEDAPAHLTVSRGLIGSPQATPTDSTGPLGLPGASSPPGAPPSKPGHRSLWLAIAVCIALVIVRRRWASRRQPRNPQPTAP